MADDRRTNRGRRKSDRYARVSVFLLLGIIICLGIVLAYLVSVVDTLGNQNDQLAAQASKLEGVVSKQREFSQENAKAAFKLCKRGNQTRPVTIKGYLNGAEGNRARAAAWRQIRAGLPVPVDGIREQIEANLDEARGLQRKAEKIADAQVEVSKHPHARSLVKRSIVDCQGQFKRKPGEAG